MTPDDVMGESYHQGLVVANLLCLSAGIGIWDWDVVKDELIWDDSMYRLFGIRKEDFSGACDAWAKSLAPEDFEWANAEVQAALRGEREWAGEDFALVMANVQMTGLSGIELLRRVVERFPEREFLLDGLEVILFFIAFSVEKPARAYHFCA